MKTPIPTTSAEAVAIFDYSADHTKPNHQTAAWEILKAERDRLLEVADKTRALINHIENTSITIFWPEVSALEEALENL